MSAQSSTQTEDRKKGVRRWLLFFCVVLTFFVPVATIYIVSGYNASSPHLRVAGLSTLITIDFLASIAVAAFSLAFATQPVPQTRITTLTLLSRFGACMLMLVAIAAGRSESQAQPRNSSGRSQSFGDVQREYLEVRRAYQQFEDKVRGEREDYYQRNNKRFNDLKWKIVDMLWDLAKGKSPNSMPKLTDISGLIDDYEKYVGATANDIMDLRTEAAEIDLRMQKANQRYAELRRADEVATRLGSRAPRQGPPLVKPPPLPDSKPANPDELDDAIDLWGYRELGDRYFDGRARAWQRFIAKHPEYKKGVSPDRPPSTSAKNQNDAASSDSDDIDAVEDDDAMDAFGFMTEGEHYFDIRPGAWDRFKERHPDYKDLTWSALETSERAEMLRRALQLEMERYSRDLYLCNSIKDPKWREECISKANRSHASNLKWMNRDGGNDQ